MGYIETIGAALWEPLKGLVSTFVMMIPSIVIAAILVLFGYIFGAILGHAIKHALHKLKFDEKFKQLHLAKPLEKIHLSGLLGWVVKWYTFVIFVAAGASFLRLDIIEDIINTFAAWVPNLLLAMVIVLGGAVAAEYMHKMIMHVSLTNVKIMADIAKYFIMIVVIVFALKQIVDVSPLENLLLILVGGVSLGLAIAVGVSFGLAFKDHAGDWIESVKKK